MALLALNRAFDAGLFGAGLLVGDLKFLLTAKGLHNVRVCLRECRRVVRGDLGRNGRGCDDSEKQRC